jgi:hypothetical protein
MWQSRHQSNRKLLTHKKGNLISFGVYSVHSTHSFLHSFIHHVLRIIDLEACGINKSLDEGSSGSAIVAECGEADFCLEQVIS